VLDALDEFGIVGTWAFVGHLFFAQCEPCTICPILDWQQKYPSFSDIYQSAHPLWYGADLLASVRSRPTPHEIAFHGYTHSVFDEAQMTTANATTEIQEWQRLGKRHAITPRSVVFPRNKVGHLDLLRQAGFTSYRGEERLPAVCTLPVIGRFFRRFYYTVAAVHTPPVYEGRVDQSGLVNLPASRWIFGFNRRADWLLDHAGLHQLRIHKMAAAIPQAAQQHKIVHFWAHPYEFRTRRDVDKLRYLLERAAIEIDKGHLQSVGMATLADIIQRRNGVAAKCPAQSSPVLNPLADKGG
jgi:hypothetical protein